VKTKKAAAEPDKKLEKVRARYIKDLEKAIESAKKAKNARELDSIPTITEKTDEMLFDLRTNEEGGF
jgi:hypothetical protein